MYCHGSSLSTALRTQIYMIQMICDRYCFLELRVPCIGGTVVHMGQSWMCWSTDTCLNRSLPGFVIQCVASLQWIICGHFRWRSDRHGEALYELVSRTSVGIRLSVVGIVNVVIRVSFEVCLNEVVSLLTIGSGNSNLEQENSWLLNSKYFMW